jgi:integrase
MQDFQRKADVVELEGIEVHDDTIPQNTERKELVGQVLDGEVLEPGKAVGPVRKEANLAPNQLTPAFVASIKTPGQWSDGGNTGLCVRAVPRKGKGVSVSFVLRYGLGGKARAMSLGPAQGAKKISLATARQKTKDARALINGKKDPALDRKQRLQDELNALQLDKAQGKTFRDVLALRMKRGGEGGWSAKHYNSWKRTMEMHAAPLMGIPMQQLSFEHIKQVLDPVYKRSYTLGHCIRTRVAEVWDEARVLKFVKGGVADNPARWDGNFEVLYGVGAKSRDGKAARATKSWEAITWDRFPELCAEIREVEGSAARALEFTVLGALRIKEPLAMKWKHLSMVKVIGSAVEIPVYTIPPKVAKMGEEHQVVLTPRMQEIIKIQGKLRCRADEEGEDYVFLGTRMGKVIHQSNVRRTFKELAIVKSIKPSPTVHGCRSAFKDLCSDLISEIKDESSPWYVPASDKDSLWRLSEHALSHKQARGDSVASAYARSTLLRRRKRLMEVFEAYCMGTLSLPNLD